MKKQVILGIVVSFSLLILCLPASATSLVQSEVQHDHVLPKLAPTTRRGCDGGYLAKVPWLALSCRDLLTRMLHAPIASKQQQIASNWVSDYLSTVPQTARFTVPFFSRQWHFAATAGQPLDLPDIDVMRDGANATVDPHRGWGAQQSAAMRYFQGDETEYYQGNNNLLFELRFSFYPTQH
jgi:hypothetical protein